MQTDANSDGLTGLTKDNEVGRRDTIRFNRKERLLALFQKELFEFDPAGIIGDPGTTGL